MFYVTRRWKSTARRIDKLLIANRGEIACRVIRTARRMGIKTVAVYSDADKDALHVAEADEAYRIGAPPAALSYLDPERVLGAARRAGAAAVHPGYGFLSESAAFAAECRRRGLAYLGPPAAAVAAMGDKSRAKALAAEAGVPVLAGYHGADQGAQRLRAEAERVAFPLVVKAVLGGGGKGMRVAGGPAEFEEALRAARSEARKAFGDDQVLLERFIAEPRHVEVQIFADCHGNVVHLFERDCSVQRRHQKIIEEAPAPGLTEEVRHELGMAAVRVAKAVGYEGAGTVEFIMDRVDQKFYFMEMNTRLQVEHPITEMITGTDLVEWQIRVASGEELPLTQEQIRSRGHAFEARIYAEDPEGGFLPGAGLLSHLRTPEAGSDVRIETGVREGDEVTVHYDPMIAKLVVWGEDRGSALGKLHRNLLDYNIAGLETNVNFLLSLSEHPEFVAGNVHTNFIRDNYDSLFKKKVISEKKIIQGFVCSVLREKLKDKSDANNRQDQFNPFVIEAGFRPSYKLERDIKIKLKDEEISAKIKYLDYNQFEISLDDGKNWKIIDAELEKQSNKIILKTTIEEVKNQVNVFYNEDIITIFDEDGKTEFSLEKPKFLSNQNEESSSDLVDKAISPMPGVLDKVLVSIGDEVKKGDSLFVLIAMKMEYVVKANRDAVVKNIFFKVGDNVTKDAVIVQFDN